MPDIAVIQHHADPDDRLNLWRAAFDAWLKRVELGSPHTRELYVMAWRSFVRFVPKMPWEVRQEDVESWQRARAQEGLSANTLNVYLAAISAFYQYALGLYPPLAVYNPTRNIRRLRAEESEVDYVTPDEFRKMFEAIPAEGLENLRDRAMLIAYWSTALRNAAVRTMRLRDLSYKREQVYLRYHSKGKTRTRVYPALAWVHLAAYLGARARRLEAGQTQTYLAWLETAWRRYDATWPDDDDYVFVNHASNAHWISVGKPLSDTAWLHVLERRSVDIIGRRVRSHMLRHGSARALEAAGLSPLAIMETLDHTDLAVTTKYLKRFQTMDAKERAAQTVLAALGL